MTKTALVLFGFILSGGFIKDLANVNKDGISQIDLFTSAQAKKRRKPKARKNIVRMKKKAAKKKKKKSKKRNALIKKIKVKKAMCLFGGCDRKGIRKLEKKLKK